ncbi:MAG: cupredoxin domain-containing protein [Clostridia bacterium]
MSDFDKRRALIHAGAAAAMLAGGLVAFPARPQEQVVRITARKFVFLPRELTLKKGVPVVLELTSPEVVMGFNCPALNVRADIIPGQTTRLRFTPDKAGEFDFLCDIFCGDGHEGMSGKLRVEA